MNKLFNKLNIVNAILKLLFRLRRKQIVVFDVWCKKDIWSKYEKDKMVEQYGWHWDNSYHKNNWTTYDRSLYEGMTNEFMLYPNSRIDFYGKIGQIKGKQTAYWLLQQEIEKYCEIDVVEYDKRLGKLLFTSYFNPKSKWMNGSWEIEGLNQAIQSQGKLKVEESFVREKHLYSVKWGYKKLLGVKIKYIVWYIDNIPIAFTMRNVPDQPMFICVNNVRLKWIDWIQVEDL